MLDRTRKSLVAPADEEVEVPIVVKRKAQVLAVSGKTAQLMDLEDYSQFELEIPEERREEVRPGNEVDYYEVLGIKTLKKIK